MRVLRQIRHFSSKECIKLTTECQEDVAIFCYIFLLIATFILRIKFDVRIKTLAIENKVMLHGLNN